MCIKRVAQNIAVQAQTISAARTGREPRGPGQRPGVEADVDSSRFASARLRRSPGSAKAGGVKGGPSGPSAAALYIAGYHINPTDGERDLHRHDLRGT
jgi:hypothetical protein